MLGLRAFHFSTQDIKEKKIRTHMTFNISIYFSKQQLITELTKNSVL